jgi:hypothetical protein
LRYKKAEGGQQGLVIVEVGLRGAVADYNAMRRNEGNWHLVVLEGMLITMVNSVNGMAHEMAAILGRCEVVNLQITRQKDCTATTSIQTVTPSPLPSNVLPDVEKASLTGSIASSAPCVSTDTGYGAIQIGRSPDVMSVSSQFADNAGVSSRTTEDFDTSKKDKGDGKASFFEAQETKARTKDRFSLNSVGSVNPLIQYLPKPRERRTWKMAFKDVLHQLGGTPCSLGFNLRRLRISNTTDQKFEDIIQTLMNVRCSEAEDFNDVSTMLRDTRVEWSFFDIVEAGTRRAQYWVLAQYSILGHMIATTQAMIAYYSIWYVTLYALLKKSWRMTTISIQSLAHTQLSKVSMRSAMRSIFWRPFPVLGRPSSTITHSLRRALQQQFGGAQYGQPSSGWILRLVCRY